MSTKSPTEPEWMHLALDAKSDSALYRSPRNSPGTGLPVERGTDLLVHRSPGGTLYYYFYHWSLYENETNICQITSKDSAREFILEHARQSDRLNIVFP